MVTSSREVRVQTGFFVEDRSDPAPNPVALHRISHGTWYCERDACVLRGVQPGDQANRPHTMAATFGPKAIEGGTAAEPIDHADRRARPF
ncbi:MAG: hypothetical protein DHS20C19_04160 [Acidimicrobiales bacterium]|nr:MAG: hypothetical protein DHS20C19_04160 [Acidimicrobiales bacterium]